MIARLQPSVVVCFGQTAGNYVRRRLFASQEIDEFVEQNNRRWRSSAYVGVGGIKVVVASHPALLTGATLLQTSLH